MSMPMVAGRSSPDKVHAIDVVVVGDKEAEFASFMARSAPALARTAWLLCGDTHVAEELVQQALMKTYLAWPKARQGEPLAYARRVLANLRIDRWRRRRREVLMASDTLPDRSDGSPGPADRHAERDRLSRALLTLPTKQRRIVVLRHLEGLSEREVADATGVSVGTVKSTASRGIARLREVLQTEDAADAVRTTTTPTGTTDERSGS
ncbi:SigE family RNA polymerase sigma factor [Promicromonospora iranensis]|uniref:RNA polymerase sigma-70 factor (Sigma-E family) n=1 Tax=Promicromonospora iranensis TaxID=1105144 RepID=A0ABU2CPK6_9MICO|nr:SigE family RNA polymerase sigma factor [Promicromonospora iranensis]MDR7383206.1 RNA polymerase sigma-70 factor (sigma-E family) [Promicromonospora iranensis]